MIRLARKTDLPDLIAFSRRQALETRVDLPWEQDICDLQIRHLLISSKGTWLVNEVDDKITGVIGGPIMPWPFNHSVQAAQEYIALGDNLESLRKRFDSWAESQGASAVIKLCVDSTKGPRVRMLKRSS